MLESASGLRRDHATAPLQGKEGMGFYVDFINLGYISPPGRNPEPGINSVLFTNSISCRMTIYSHPQYKKRETEGGGGDDRGERV